MVTGEVGSGQRGGGQWSHFNIVRQLTGHIQRRLGKQKGSKGLRDLDPYVFFVFVKVRIASF